MKSTTNTKHMMLSVITGAWLAVAVLPVHAADGEAIFNKSCRMCHGTGMMGAPQVGDAKAWKPLIAKERETLYENSINGFRGEATMPARGGNSSLTDEEVKAAVDYMVEQSQ